MGHNPGAGDVCQTCGVTLPNANLDEANITVTTFEKLKECLEDPKTAIGSDYSQITVRLGANIIAPKDGLIEQLNKLEVTLDLHGYTLTLYNSAYNGTDYGKSGFFVRGAMMIKDSSLASCGKIVAAETDNNGDDGLITVEKTSTTGLFGKSNNQFIWDSGTIDSSNNPNGCAIMMWHSGRVTIEGGTVKAKSYAISGSTGDTMLKGRLIINGGWIESENSYAIYHPQAIKIMTNASEPKYGAFHINGGTIKGKDGAIYDSANCATKVTTFTKDSTYYYTVKLESDLGSANVAIYAK